MIISNKIETNHDANHYIYIYLYPYKPNYKSIQMIVLISKQLRILLTSEQIFWNSLNLKTSKFPTMKCNPLLYKFIKRCTIKSVVILINNRSTKSKLHKIQFMFNLFKVLPSASFNFYFYFQRSKFKNIYISVITFQLFLSYKLFNFS